MNRSPITRSSVDCRRLRRVKVRPAVTQTGVLRHRMSVDGGDEELYRKYADDLTRFATALVGPCDAGDVVSEAVLSCFTSPKWMSVTNRRSYLYRSVYNKARQFHRTAKRRRQRDHLGVGAEFVEPPEVRPEVVAAVFRLSMRQRAVIVLTYWEDLGINSAGAGSPTLQDPEATASGVQSLVTSGHFKVVSTTPLDGQPATELAGQGGPLPGSSLTLWVSESTHLPIQAIGTDSEGSRQITTYQWLDRNSKNLSLVDLSVPPGFTHLSGPPPREAPASPLG